MCVSMISLLLLSVFPLAAPAPSGGCGGPLPAQPQPGQHAMFSLAVEDPALGEVERRYSLHLPSSYLTSNSRPVSLVVDYHGWTGSASQQMEVTGRWPQVADEDPEGFIYIAMEGMSDVVGGGSFGSWNVSRTDGPLGLTCDPPLHGSYPCFSSCGDCSYLEDSCDWTSCHDDLAYTEAVLYQVLATYCVNTDTIHLSGASNGGMFLYTRALPTRSASFASLGPVAASPLRGFASRPDSPVNIIDFHGLLDDVIPYSPEGPSNLGPGPDGTVISNDGYYYMDKMIYLTDLLTTMHCHLESSDYTTDMDGVDGWNCVIWTGCDEGKEVVHCNANWGHMYPFQGRVEAFRIIWQFMKDHPLTPQ